MIKLRLQRRGRKKRPYYHIVVADQRFPRDGRVIERLGRFDNVSENKQLILDEDRIIHWLKIGAKPSDTVRSLLKQEGILYKMHLIRWGKSDEEIEATLSAWKESKSTGEEKEVSRREQQKTLLEAEEKEYQKQLKQKAEEAAKQAEKEKAEAAAAEAEAEAEKAAAEAETSEDEASDTEEKAAEPEVKVDEAPAEAESGSEPADAAASEEPQASETEEKAAEPEVKEVEAPASDEAPSEKESSSEEATSASVSTALTANDAIEHIKNTPLDQLEGFVPEDEDRVTVRRAWDNKKSG